MLLSLSPENGIKKAENRRKEGKDGSMKNRIKTHPAGRSSRKEKLAVIMKKLEDGVHDLFTSENYRNYLKTMSQFHQYSFSPWIVPALVPITR